MRAIQVSAPGGPEALVPADLPEPVPGPGELVVRVTAAGVNFIDTYRRAGVYPAPMPHVPGDEGAGTVVALGEGVAGTTVGDHVAWADGSHGSYAELAVVRADRAVPVPDGVPDEVAAAVMLQGMTAHYLVESTFPVREGQTVLVHAGAGGVGLLLTQLARARGARVLSTVSTPEKARLSAAAGAEPIRYDQLEDLTAELPRIVRDLAPGGVDTVYDGVGRATFDASLACLRPRGGLALFGGSSGQVPPFDPQRLNSGGSLFLTRPTLGHHVATRAELEQRAGAVLGAVADGTLDVRIGARFALADAADAHRALEGRATTGKVLLVP
ncbi:quinone oxidoreductase [Actinotalea sp. JY-7885]|uniref:quinone oxidoreductase family protein n=1 Tax=Actinotalea sp. JY-7885 TaxID=2758576 RepID=UPI00165D41EB|nr:quinone oxidoreductase [Actinotalea sp. JY-7885]